MPHDVFRLSQLSRFLLKSIGYMGVLSFPWYAMAAYLAIPPTWLASFVMKSQFNWVQAVQAHGVVIELITHVGLLVPQGDRHVVGFMQPDVNFLTYGYGLVLYLALMLASKTGNTWWQSGVGAMLLVPVQAACMCCHWLAVVLQGGATARAATGLQGWSAELVAYGYQFGFLILTPLTPVVIWLLFNQGFAKRLWIEMVLTGEMERRVMKS